MYAMRFGEEPPERRSVEQLRGIEGARVREMYKRLARKYGVEWEAREYDPDKWDASDLPNRCLSAATSCLYGVSEAAVPAAGCALKFSLCCSESGRCALGELDGSLPMA